MILSLIVAVAENGIIGGGNRLLWSLPDDMRHFREVTKGHTVIMGHRTYDSIGHPLPGRQNIVISRREGLTIDGCSVVSSLENALTLARESGETEAIVIGGGQIYAQALPLADRVYFTRVHAAFQGDVSFPELSPQEWREVSREEHSADARHKYSFTFLVYERRR